MNDEAFELFLDEIIGNDDFSKCHDMYRKKRFDGGKEACSQYEEPEIIEIPDDEDVNTYILFEKMKHQNVDEIIKYLYNSNNEIVNKAISSISTYVRIGNKDAYEGLINYYMSLDSAVSLEDVYIRMNIVDSLSTKESEQNTIEAYVNELVRTPSNNTTRQLYSLILKRLGKCPEEMIREPLLQLLEKRQYSYKMKKRIMEIVGI
ncbi:hypothetical protein [Tepidanaerobacter sp. EBM-38]|uniref:hypothetical protein n=1 Tax=Tepidanaerobacter sp. EBM-38 TaxID=1918496 RepID=UPI0025F2C926|nr:hypothetical protein [Tepidanaerobacter sp. EBM-38]